MNATKRDDSADSATKSAFAVLETIEYPNGSEYVVLGFEGAPATNADPLGGLYVAWGTRKPLPLQDAIMKHLKRSADKLERQAREARYRYNRAKNAAASPKAGDSAPKEGEA